MIVPDWFFILVVPAALLGYYVLLGGLFHLIDWIYPNKVTKWCRSNLVDATLDPRFRGYPIKDTVFGEDPK